MKEIMTICPYMKCKKVIFREGEVDIQSKKADIFSFITICPHCKNKIRIKLGIITKAEPIF